MILKRIVSTPAQALSNIEKFERELIHSAELQDRLPYARAWYAHKDQNNEWRFAPSKFIGYLSIDAAEYLTNAESNDGRRTEAQLQSWFRTVNETDTVYHELHSGLVAFLARYGKTPSTKARISILRPRRSIIVENNEPVETNADNIVAMIIAVAKGLPSKQFRKLRDQLEDIWS